MRGSCGSEVTRQNQTFAGCTERDFTNVKAHREPPGGSFAFTGKRFKYGRRTYRILERKLSIPSRSSIRPSVEAQEPRRILPPRSVGTTPQFKPTRSGLSTMGIHSA